MVNRIIFGIATIFALAAAHAAPAQLYNTAPLQVKFGDWTATDKDGAFADTWTAGKHQLTFVTTRSEPQFAMLISGFTPPITDGAKINLQLGFDKGPSLRLTAQANHNILTAPIPDAEVAAWTHGLTGGQQLTIQGTPDGVWIVPLEGTTPTISAMAEAISFAGINGLPAPFDTAVDTPTSNPPPPINEAKTFSRYGYNFIIFDRITHTPDRSGNSGSGTIDQEIPQIIDPLTPQSVVFNQNARQFMEATWSLCGAPRIKNLTTKDSYEDFWLWVGFGTGSDSPYTGPDDLYQDLQDTLPGVISVRFKLEGPPVSGYGGTCDRDFNWILAKERPVEINDIFSPDRNWQEVMISYINARRGRWASNSSAPDLSKEILDPTAWLLLQEGIEIVFSHDEFDGNEDFGATIGVTVPWSVLKPYLKKDGLASSQGL